MQTPSFEYLSTRPLLHHGDCTLLGVTPDLTVYVEEVYGDEGWLAQHAISADGTILASVDEHSGTMQDLEPLPLPDDLVEPRRGWHTMRLNFAGPRHRGMRVLERLDDLVQPISVQEKFALVTALKLDIMPPMLVGLAESYVLAETTLRSPNLFMVCRRLRLAYVLPEPKTDSDDNIYDYNTQVVYAAHLFDTAATQEIALPDTLRGLPGVVLSRPMDCLITQDHLFIADGGEGDRLSAVHIWRIVNVEPKLSDDGKF